MLKKRLEELAILARRDAYFKEKAHRRQQGLPLQREKVEEAPEWNRKTNTNHAALDIESLMNAWQQGTVFDSEAESRAVAAMTWLIHGASA